jgi:hypothetical protein
VEENQRCGGARFHRFRGKAQSNGRLNNRRRNQLMRAYRSLFMVVARRRGAGNRRACGCTLHAHHRDKDRNHQPQHSSSRLTSSGLPSSFIRRISPFAGLRNFSRKNRFMLGNK